MKEDLIKHKAEKIVDKHYQQNKNKSPLTQVAKMQMIYWGINLITLLAKQ